MLPPPPACPEAPCQGFQRRPREHQITTKSGEKPLPSQVWWATLSDFCPRTVFPSTLLHSLTRGRLHGLHRPCSQTTPSADVCLRLTGGHPRPCRWPATSTTWLLPHAQPLPAVPLRPLRWLPLRAPSPKSSMRGPRDTRIAGELRKPPHCWADGNTNLVARSPQEGTCTPSPRGAVGAAGVAGKGGQSYTLRTPGTGHRQGSPCRDLAAEGPGRRAAWNQTHRQGHCADGRRLRTLQSGASPAPKGRSRACSWHTATQAEGTTRAPPHRTATLSEQRKQGSRSYPLLLQAAGLQDSTGPETVHPLRASQREALASLPGHGRAPRPAHTCRDLSPFQRVSSRAAFYVLSLTTLLFLFGQSRKIQKRPHSC